MNDQLGIAARASPSQALEPGTPGLLLDTRAYMRFARDFSMVRTVMRRATPPAALGLIATNRYRPVQPCPRQGAPPPARLACAGSRTHTRPARPRAPWAILCPGALFHNFCAQIRAGLDDQSF